MADKAPERAGKFEAQQSPKQEAENEAARLRRRQNRVAEEIKSLKAIPKYIYDNDTELKQYNGDKQKALEKFSKQAAAALQALEDYNNDPDGSQKSLDDIIIALKKANAAIYKPEFAQYTEATLRGQAKYKEFTRLLIAGSRISKKLGDIIRTEPANKKIIQKYRTALTKALKKDVNPSDAQSVTEWVENVRDIFDAIGNDLPELQGDLKLPPSTLVEGIESLNRLTNLKEKVLNSLANTRGVKNKNKKIEAQLLSLLEDLNKKLESGKTYEDLSADFCQLFELEFYKIQDTKYGEYTDFLRGKMKSASRANINTKNGKTYASRPWVYGYTPYVMRALQWQKKHGGEVIDITEFANPFKRTNPLDFITKLDKKQQESTKEKGKKFEYINTLYTHASKQLDLFKRSLDLVPEYARNLPNYRKAKALYGQWRASLARAIAGTDSRYSSETFGRKQKKDLIKHVQESMRYASFAQIQAQFTQETGNFWKLTDSEWYISAGDRKPHVELLSAYKLALSERLSEPNVVEQLKTAKGRDEYARTCLTIAGAYRNKSTTLDRAYGMPKEVRDGKFSVDLLRRGMGFNKLLMKHAEVAGVENTPFDKEIARRKAVVENQRKGVLEGVKKVNPKAAEAFGATIDAILEAPILQKQDSVAPHDITMKSAIYTVYAKTNQLIVQADQYRMDFEGASAKQQRFLLGENGVRKYLMIDQKTLGDMKGSCQHMAKQYFDDVGKSLASTLEDKGAGYISSSLGVTLTPNQRKCFDLLADIEGHDFWDLSDETWNTIEVVGQVAVYITAGIAIGMATGGLGLGVMSGMLLEGAALTALTATLNRIGVDSLGEGVEVYGKQLLINSAFGGLGRGLGAVGRVARSSKVGVKGFKEYSKVIKELGKQGAKQLDDIARSSMSAGEKLTYFVLGTSANSLSMATLTSLLYDGNFNNLENNLKQQAYFLALPIGGALVRRNPMKGMTMPQRKELQQMMRANVKQIGTLHTACSKAGVDVNLMAQAKTKADVSQLVKARKDYLKANQTSSPKTPAEKAQQEKIAKQLKALAQVEKQGKALVDSKQQFTTTFNQYEARALAKRGVIGSNPDPNVFPAGTMFKKGKQYFIVDKSGGKPRFYLATKDGKKLDLLGGRPEQLSGAKKYTPKKPSRNPASSKEQQKQPSPSVTPHVLPKGAKKVTSVDSLKPNDIIHVPGNKAVIPCRKTTDKSLTAKQTVLPPGKYKVYSINGKDILLQPVGTDKKAYLVASKEAGRFFKSPKSLTSPKPQPTKKPKNPPKAPQPPTSSKAPDKTPSLEPRSTIKIEKNRRILGKKVQIKTGKNGDYREYPDTVEQLPAGEYKVIARFDPNDPYIKVRNKVILRDKNGNEYAVDANAFSAGSKTKGGLKPPQGPKSPPKNYNQPTGEDYGMPTKPRTRSAPIKTSPSKPKATRQIEAKDVKNLKAGEEIYLSSEKTSVDCYIVSKSGIEEGKLLPGKYKIHQIKNGSYELRRDGDNTKRYVITADEVVEFSKKTGHSNVLPTPPLPGKAPPTPPQSSGQPPKQVLKSPPRPRRKNKAVQAGKPSQRQPSKSPAPQKLQLEVTDKSGEIKVTQNGQEVTLPKGRYELYNSTAGDDYKFLKAADGSLYHIKVESSATGSVLDKLKVVIPLSDRRITLTEDPGITGVKNGKGKPVRIPSEPETIEIATDTFVEKDPQYFVTSKTVKGELKYYLKSEGSGDVYEITAKDYGKLKARFRSPSKGKKLSSGSQKAPEQTREKSGDLNEPSPAKAREQIPKNWRKNADFVRECAKTFRADTDNPLYAWTGTEYVHAPYGEYIALNQPAWTLFISKADPNKQFTCSKLQTGTMTFSPYTP